MMKTETRSAGSSLIQLKVSGLMCSFCTMSVEKALARVPGVRNVQVNLVHGIVLTDAVPGTDPATIARGIENLGYTVVATEAQQFQTDEAIFATIRKRGILAMAVAVADLLVDPLNLFGLDARIRAAISGIAALIVLLWIGFPILRKTLLAARQRVINANVLLSTGAWAAFAIGALHWFDEARWPNYFPVAVWLMALHLFFGFFKLGTRKAAAESVRKLLSLQAQTARIMRNGEEMVLPATSVVAGDRIIIKPGERIPLDGTVTEGSASIDASAVTGESKPLFKKPGDEVIGGTINLDGLLLVNVSKAASEGFVAQVVRLMQQIEERKPPIQLLMDRLMNYYGPVVFMVAGVTFLGWLAATGDFARATLIALTTIIMGYPCALGITTPMVLAIGGGHGIARGFLVRAGEIFQALAGVDTVVFDKTGTLTYGRPTVRTVAAASGDANALLALAAAAERGSEHPIAGAIVRYAELHGVRIPNAGEFRAVPGLGVSAKVAGRTIRVGRKSWLESELRVTPFVNATEARDGQYTWVYVASDHEALGVIAVEDMLRPGARSAIAELHTMGVGTVMLTGDARSVANATARDLGIQEVHAELMPAAKVEVIERLQKEGSSIAMVGDGINDAPALVQADVGIALGAGTDVALESAGVVLVSDKLDRVVGAIRLGRASHRKMKQNIAIAVLSNLIGMSLAVTGSITVTAAIAIMALSVIAVLLSTASLLRLRLVKDTEVFSTDAKLVETVIAARRMHCENCANTISRELIRVEGVASVVPDVSRKDVVIVFDPNKVDEARLRSKLVEIGF